MPNRYRGSHVHHVPLTHFERISSGHNSLRKQSFERHEGQDQRQFMKSFMSIGGQDIFYFFCFSPANFRIENESY